MPAQGRIAWRDEVLWNDVVAVEIEGLAQPAEGQVYAVWLAGEQGSLVPGRLAADGNRWQVAYASPVQANLLAAYDRVCITGVPAAPAEAEAVNVSRTGVLPPQALVHKLSCQPCPIADPHFAKGGCTTHFADAIGTRIRHQLDRESEEFKQRYTQRTMVERINSQAEALGMVRPKLRRGSAIANQNTLTYVLINLRALQRQRTAALEERPSPEAVTLMAWPSRQLPDFVGGW